MRAAWPPPRPPRRGRLTLDIDEQGPAGESPLATFGFTEGTRVGSLTWSTAGVCDVEVTTTLASTANVVDRENTGPGHTAGTMQGWFTLGDDTFMDFEVAVE